MIRRAGVFADGDGDLYLKCKYISGERASQSRRRRNFSGPAAIQRLESAAWPPRESLSGTDLRDTPTVRNAIDNAGQFEIGALAAQKIGSNRDFCG